MYLLQWRIQDFTWGAPIITARKRSLRRLCFHGCVSLLGGGGSLSRGGVSVKETHHTVTCGLYTSYWNTFLFGIIFAKIVWKWKKTLWGARDLLLCWLNALCWEVPVTQDSKDFSTSSVDQWVVHHPAVFLMHHENIKQVLHWCVILRIITLTNRRGKLTMFYRQNYFKKVFLFCLQWCSCHWWFKVEHTLYITLFLRCCDAHTSSLLHKVLHSGEGHVSCRGGEHGQTS